MWVLGDAYLAAQVVVVPAVLVWLYRPRRVIYVRLRGTVLATWTPLIVLAVVATGNHFLFDVVAGVAVTTAGYGVGSIGRS
jgi:hypothetical protein